MRKEFRLYSGLSQKIINRALNLLSMHSKEIVLKLWENLTQSTVSKTCGLLTLPPLSETVITMARYEMKCMESTVEEKGRRQTVTEKHYTETNVWALGYLTLTRIIEKERRKQVVHSNWNLISGMIFDNMGSGFVINQSVLV